MFLRTLTYFFIPQCLKSPYYSNWPSHEDHAIMAAASSSIQALYDKQRLIKTKTFKGKTPRIAEQYNNFWAQKSAKADVDAYSRGLSKDKHSYASLDRWVQPDTIFTNPKGKLDEDDHCSIVGNFQGFDVAQYQDHPGTASMSFIHLLALPKERIFNGVSLTRKNVVVLQQMVDRFRAEFDKPEFRQKIIDQQREAIERRFTITKDQQARDLALQHLEELGGKIHKLERKDFQFGLHLWPDHSISHLHLHILAMTDEMRKYSTTNHDTKTKDAFEVRDFILSHAPKL